MNLALIKNVVTSKAGMQLLAVQRHSPVLLMGVGIVGVVGTIVLSTRATLKLSEVLDEFEDQKDLIKNTRENHPERYTDKNVKHDLLVVHSKLVRDVVVLYAPSVILGSMSIAALGGSHVIMSRRNAGLTASVAALDRALREYRGRVVADVGADKDLEYMFGTNTREELSQTKKGEPKVTTVTTFGEGRSPYSRIFDEENLNFQEHASYNIFFLKMVQNQLNDRLRARGHVFLNDAYRDLGYPDTHAGAVTGWVWNRGFDDYIDFGIWDDDNRDAIKSFMRGNNGSILLDFNVDGPILNELPKGLN